MKKLNKKGFTLVELVIVIAVIAILAAVLIPVFSNVIANANKSKAMQAARNEFELYMAEEAKTLSGTEDYYIKSGDYWFDVTDLQFNAEPLANTPDVTGKIDVTIEAIKSTTVSDADTAPSITGVTKYYSNPACTTEITDWTGKTVGTTVYYIGDAGIEGQNDDVAIYSK